MAHQTEAACLLETGAQYGTRVMLRPAAGDPIFAGFKPGAFSLYFGDEPIYHFDRDGRWQRAFVGGIHYLKGLDTSVQAIDRVREGANLVLKRRTLSFAETTDLDALVRSAAIETLAARDLERVEPPPKAQALSPEALRDELEQIASWDAAAWFAHRERYLATYGPLPFLPPDLPAALVVQATLGHAGGIAFGGGAAATHAVRTEAEFRQHVDAVARLLGRRTLQCRAVFLAGSDALRQPRGDVAGFLEAIGRAFPIVPREDRRARDSNESAPRLEGIHSFLDDFATPRPTRDDWHHYHGLHLNRVSLGVESGDASLRSLYRKSWRNDDLVAIVADLKAAGIGVGVITTVGAGGEEHAASHVPATAALINSLPLGPGDLVSLVDAEALCDPGHRPRGFTPLAAARAAEQQAELKQALLPIKTNRGAKVAPYALEKQGL